MRVRETLTQKTVEVNASYGARLIEQGKAVLCEAESVVKETAKEKTAKKQADA